MAQKTILVVEDTKNIRDIVVKILRTKGYIVYEADHGVEGARLAQTQVPDLIVLDGMLPDKDGFEICAELKRNPKYKSIRIIMLTAITSGSSKPEAYWKEKSGADDFMTKPFRMNALLARIEKLIGEDSPAAGTPN